MIRINQIVFLFHFSFVLLAFLLFTLFLSLFYLYLSRVILHFSIFFSFFILSAMFFWLVFGLFQSFSAFNPDFNYSCYFPFYFLIFYLFQIYPLVFFFTPTRKGLYLYKSLRKSYFSDSQKPLTFWIHIMFYPIYGYTCVLNL